MFRAAGAYVVGAWIVLQVADVVGPALDLPDGTVRILVWIAAAGLPVVVALAWAFEWTSQGVRREAGSRGDGTPPAAADRTADGARRLIVLPFRILRPDAETDFLAFALPDAITCNLAGIRSLVVRSSLAAGRFDPTTPLDVLAREADVDVVLTGSLLRGGDELEIRTQLADARDGTLLWSQTSRAGVEDLFRLQEQVTRRIVESLALPLSAREHRQLGRDAPRTPHAYELYLRANQLGLQVNRWADALELYLECLREDPGFAPAWARAGRCHRLLGKYAADPEVAAAEASRAEAAFRRALELNPDLPLAHSLYADHEVDTNRAEEAMLRLLGRLEASGPEPELLSGLVQACRFCGLLDASLAAHRLARELDPQVRSSVAHTHFMAGDYESALGTYNAADIGYMECVALTALGREEEALERLREKERATPPGSLVLLYISSLRSLLEGDFDQSLATIRKGAAQRDGEGRYYVGRQLAHMGHHDEALDLLARSLDAGYFCWPAVERDPWLDGLRDREAFSVWAARVRARHERAATAFEEARGPSLLGLASAAG